MTEQIKKLFDDNASGKRLQIRGFPIVWKEKLTFDDIGWFLFELLVKCGPIDDISISLSKNSTLYGIVDMMRIKDAQAIFDNFLDAKGHYRLEEWKCTLQFKLLDARNTEPRKSGSKQMEPKMTTEPQMVEQKMVEPNIGVQKMAAVMMTTTQKDADANGTTSRRYSREELLALRKNMTMSRKDDGGGTFRCYSREELLTLEINAPRYYKLDPEFAGICRNRKSNIRQFKEDRKSWRPGPLKLRVEKSED